MLVADTYLGNVAEGTDRVRAATEGALSVTLSDTERRRSRVRTTAEDGTEIGIVVAERLQDGDVLAADDRTVVVSLSPIDAMVLAVDESASSLRALELGHAIGNHHWELTVEDDRALLPVTEDRDRMAALVEPLLSDGTAISYEQVSPSTFDGTVSADHGHGHRRHGHDPGHETDSGPGGDRE